MFGYVTINKPEMKFREFDRYRSYYCGLCRVLKEKYGLSGQLTLSYDMTFLVLLLNGLYEPETEESSCKCIAHPFERHSTSINQATEYAADMDILLSYYKCMDDWKDEKKPVKYAYAGLLRRKFHQVEQCYPQKAAVIAGLLEKISDAEERKEKNLDTAAGLFGELMAELFVWKKDEWEETLRRIGFFLGKFIYLMDAYEDLERDIGKGSYNPFAGMYQEPAFEERVKAILTMMMAECSRAFEHLPILKEVEILRNILYAGVWCRYEAVNVKRKERTEKNDVRPL